MAEWRNVRADFSGSNRARQTGLAAISEAGKTAGRLSDSFLKQKQMEQQQAQEAIQNERAQQQLGLQEQRLGLQEQQLGLTGRRVGIAEQTLADRQAATTRSQLEKEALLRGQEAAAGIESQTTTPEMTTPVLDASGQPVTDWNQQPMTPEQAQAAQAPFDALTAERQKQAEAQGLVWDPSTNSARQPTEDELQLAYNKQTGTGNRLLEGGFPGQKPEYKSLTDVLIPDRYSPAGVLETEVRQWGKDIKGFMQTPNERLEAAIKAERNPPKELKDAYTEFKKAKTGDVNAFNSEIRAQEANLQKQVFDKYSVPVTKVVPAATKSDTLATYTDKVGKAEDKLVAQYTKEYGKGKIPQPVMDGIRQAKIQAITGYRDIQTKADLASQKLQGEYAKMQAKDQLDTDRQIVVAAAKSRLKTPTNQIKDKDYAAAVGLKKAVDDSTFTDKDTPEYNAANKLIELYQQQQMSKPGFR